MVVSQLALVVMLLAVPDKQVETPAQSCCGPCVCGICQQLAEPELAQYLMDNSSELFFGTVVAEELVACCDRRADITFKVIRRWKGAEQPQVRVRTESCTQIYPFVLGREYLVSASSRGGDPVEVLRCHPPIEGLGTAYPTISALDKIAQGSHQP